MAGARRPFQRDASLSGEDVSGWAFIALAVALVGLGWSTVERERIAADLEIAKLHCVVAKP